MEKGMMMKGIKVVVAPFEYDVWVLFTIFCGSVLLWCLYYVLCQLSWSPIMLVVLVIVLVVVLVIVLVVVLCDMNYMIYLLALTCVRVWCL